VDTHSLILSHPLSIFLERDVTLLITTMELVERFHAPFPLLLIVASRADLMKNTSPASLTSPSLLVLQVLMLPLLQTIALGSNLNRSIALTTALFGNAYRRTRMKKTSTSR
jgi:hypothetical protein